MLIANVASNADDAFARVLVLLAIASAVFGIVLVYAVFDATMRLIRTFVSLVTTSPSTDVNCPQCGHDFSTPPSNVGIIGHRQSDRICDQCGLRFAPPVHHTKTIAGLATGLLLVAAAVAGYTQLPAVDSRVGEIILGAIALFGFSIAVSHGLNLTRSITSIHNPVNHTSRVQK